MQVHSLIAPGVTFFLTVAAHAASDAATGDPIGTSSSRTPIYSINDSGAAFVSEPGCTTPTRNNLPIRTRAKSYREEQRREGWFSSLFLRPAHPDPSNQLAYARSLRDGGRPRGAVRAYRALILTWPASAEAVDALLERARLLETRGLLDDAFSDYQQLVTRYAGRFDFHEVIAQQIQLADRIMARRSLPWLFGGFSTPERALPMYAQILTNAPNWSSAPAVALRIGRIHEENGDFAEAIAAYADVRIRYPNSPEAEEADERRIECLLRLARRAPNHTAVLDEAWGSIHDFLARYPQSPRARQIAARGSDIAERRAQIAFEAARLYDRPRYSNQVVRTAYERFLTQFPDSRWAPVARRRIAELGGKEQP